MLYIVSSVSLIPWSPI